MPRRIHVTSVVIGLTRLDANEAHHIRDVLRLPDGAAVEIFDDAGNVADATLMHQGREVAVRIASIRPPDDRLKTSLTIASAVPKGDRADWLVEKLSELGVTEWIPLAAARSVVLPEGKGKRDRWVRIATEAAKQSKRIGVMKIGDLTPLAKLLSDPPKETTLWCLATERPGQRASQALNDERATHRLIFIGPEGGWTDDELARFETAKARFVTLTDTILRIETAAVTVAGIVGSAD